MDKSRGSRIKENSYRLIFMTDLKKVFASSNEETKAIQGTKIWPLVQGYHFHSQSKLIF